MDKETFIAFIEHCASGKATDGEKALLEEYLHRMEAKGEIIPTNGDLIWQRLLQQIHLQETPVRRIKRHHPYRWAAAAAAVVVLAAAGWWLFPGKSGTVPPAPVADIAPARHAATLTLADGTVIPLDDTNDGTLAQQGATAITKSDNHVLSYSQQGGQPTSIQYNTLNIPRGGQFQLVLSDGTKVWLNAASSIRYPIAFAGNARKVEVTGEAYFEIAPHAQQPFEVSVQGSTIQVLGTSFNLRAYEADDVSTTLLTGRVRVANKDGRVVLQPGQQATITAPDKTISVKAADADAAIAWKNGYFSFHNADLHTVMQELSRWYDIRIEYQGNIPDIRFEGEMQRNLKLASILKQLEQKEIHFRLKGEVLTVFQP
ncbi:FecR protein [Chitinophaga eiseniae]|uniref:FecR protein n=1 Tax=Chitinophaga eiseniae TaxID=634771 RepID=A0A1T4TAY9_9BACT|nr:FecR family protein [Chitinophaga eiseniae]SKA37644.1 FecR protein [Chitinophaga eiseniae]